MNHLNVTPRAGALERLLGLCRFRLPESPLDVLEDIYRRDLRIVSAAMGMTPELRTRFLADHPLNTRGGDVR